jgi:hypothetical protein
MLQNWSGDLKREMCYPNDELNPNSWLQFLNSRVSVDVSIVALFPNHIMIFQVLYEVGGSKVEVVNVKSMTALTFSLPFHVSSINVPSIDKWLIEDTASR